MLPAVLTHDETRQWLRSLGLKGVRLPTVGKVLYVAQPYGLETWKVTPHDSGGFLVEPYRGN